MKSFARAFQFLSFALLLFPAAAAAQDGSIQFVARITPSAGVEEPVRELPFYLLTKSFEEITHEARAQFPGPDMDTFIDKLGVSPELKTWMKRHHWVRLNGEQIVKMLTVDDIMNVPEFFTAYVARMSGDQTVHFPTPKYKPTDREKDPAKYQKLAEEYHEAVRKFLVNNPASTEGMDMNLEQVDPSNKWDQIVKENVPELQHQIQALAQSKYFVARAQTDLQGEGTLRKIPAGNYWLSTLGVSATAGDVHARWDAPVSVRGGQTTYVNLSNVNSVLGTRNTP
jgi:hypothetical protein